MKLRRVVALGLFAILSGACSHVATREAANGEAPHRDEILAAVDVFFLALATSDADAVEALYSSVAVNVIAEPEKGAAIRYRPGSGMVERMRSGDFPNFRESYWDPIVLERGGLAVVWTPYSIEENGARVHCGVDIFSMSKHDDGWKIDSLNFTMEPSACDEITPDPASIVRPDFSALDVKEK